MYRLRPELERLRPWLGFWRGPGTFRAEREMMMEMTVRPLFEGDVVEVLSSTFDPASGESISMGDGLWAPDGAGGIMAAVFSAQFGPALLREVPDDPPAVSMQSQLPGNIRFVTTILVEGDTLTMTAKRSLGYHGESETLTVASLRRITTGVQGA